MICPVLLGEGSQKPLSALWERKTTLCEKILVGGGGDQRQYIDENPHFFSADDMNITAMSKRRTLARLRRTSSVMAGASFLRKNLD